MAIKKTITKEKAIEKFEDYKEKYEQEKKANEYKVKIIFAVLGTVTAILGSYFKETAFAVNIGDSTFYAGPLLVFGIILTALPHVKNPLKK